MTYSVLEFRVLSRALGILILPYILSACGDAPPPQAEPKPEPEKTVAAPEPEKPAPAIVKKAVAEAPPKPKPAPKPPVKSSGFGPDILGLQLGMRPDEFEPIVKKALGNEARFGKDERRIALWDENSPFHIFSHGAASGGRYQTTNQINVEYAFPPDKPRVITLTRTTKYVSDAPSESSLMSAVTKKYGKPTAQVQYSAIERMKMEGANTWYWILDSGKRYCGNNPRGSLQANLDTTNCSDILTMDVRSTKNGIVQTTTLRLVDFDTYVASSKRWTKLQAELEEQRKASIRSKANSNTPAL